ARHISVGTKSEQVLSVRRLLSRVEIGPGVGFDLLQYALERRYFRLEPGDAFGQVASVGCRLRLLSRRKRYANLLAMPPDHVDAERLLLLRNIEFKHIRRCHRIGKGEAGAVGRNVADQAVDHGAAIVEMNRAAQKAFLPRDTAAFQNGSFLRTGHAVTIAPA